MSEQKISSLSKHERQARFIADNYSPEAAREGCFRATLTALRTVELETREEAAGKLDAAAVHQAEVDRHPAWDRSRSGDEPCEEHGHVYHSYPGYAAHVVAQMAKVIRGQS